MLGFICEFVAALEISATTVKLIKQITPLENLYVLLSIFLVFGAVFVFLYCCFG